MAASSDAAYTLTGAGDPSLIVGYQLDANAFHVLGTNPLIGRTFGEDDAKVGNDHVVVLGYRLWQERFGGDPSILGRAITLSGEPYTVIGVMPKGFDYPPITQLWTPLVISPATLARRDLTFIRTVARLKPGVTIQQAQAAMDSIALGLQAEYPQTDADLSIRLLSMRDWRVGDIRPVLLVLLAAGLLVLLIGCANVANLLLTRATSRQKEMAIRRALGAGRTRLIAQLMTESLVLALIGGGLGLALAAVGARAMVAMFPNNIANLNIPIVEKIPIDTTVLLFALAASLATGLLFGLAPAFQSSSFDVNQVLKESALTSTASKGKRLRELLIVAEVSLGLILLLGAGLLIRSFGRLQQTSFGFNHQNLLTMEVFLPQNKYGSAISRVQFVDTALASIRGLSEVQNVDAINFLPLSGFWGTMTVLPEGQSLPDNEWPEADRRVVTPGYFSTMGTPILSGRAFDDRDRDGSPAVAIINQTLAHRLFGADNPIGKRINRGASAKPDWLQIVGVAADVKAFGLDKETHADVYQPNAQSPSALIAFVVRTKGDPASATASVQSAVWSIDPDQPFFKVITMDRLASESLGLRRTSMLLMVGFGALGLVLVSIGLYGVLSYWASQRAHEIGIRMALGASRTDVLKLILKQGQLLFAVGAVIGLAGALIAAKLSASLLYGISAIDPVVFVFGPLFLAAVATLACYLPARRATRLDPVRALRYE
jgi:predicted permease